MLVWHSYPNIGLDSRNQYDLFRDLPGGLAGLRQMVSDFHRRGVRVLFPVEAWDQGTHKEGISDFDAITREMAAIDADGINGDTQEGMPVAFRRAADRTEHAIAMETGVGTGRR